MLFCFYKPIRKLKSGNIFTLQSKSTRWIFRQNWAKYQAYSLNFWPKLAHFSHFLLYNQNQPDGFFVKIGQNTKPIALIFGQNWPILAIFYSTIKINQMDFSSKLGKYQTYSLTFWPKLAVRKGDIQL